MLATKCLLFPQVILWNNHVCSLGFDMFVLLKALRVKRIHFPVLRNILQIVAGGLPVPVPGFPLRAPAQLAVAVALYVDHQLDEYFLVKLALTSTHVICASKIDYASSVLHQWHQITPGRPQPSLRHFRPDLWLDRMEDQAHLNEK
jgi:hypothetical protein